VSGFSTIKAEQELQIKCQDSVLSKSENLITTLEFMHASCHWVVFLVEEKKINFLTTSIHKNSDILGGICLGIDP